MLTPDNIMAVRELTGQLLHSYCVSSNELRMDLTLHLNDDGAFANQPMAEAFSLDGLCEMFGVTAHHRHTAGGDAFLTARVFLHLLRAAKAVGRTTLASLCERYHPA